MNDTGEPMGNAEDHDLLLRLDTKMDQVLKAIAEIPEVSRRVGVLESKQQTDRAEIERLRGQNTAWSVLNTIGVFVAGILGYFK